MAFAHHHCRWPSRTTIAINFAYLLGGAIIIEQIFFLPGLGRLIIDAETRRDYTVIQGATLLPGLVFLLSSLVADLVYAYLDPRVRYRDCPARRSLPRSWDQHCL